MWYAAAFSHFSGSCSLSGSVSGHFETGTGGCLLWDLLAHPLDLWRVHAAGQSGGVLTAIVARSGAMRLARCDRVVIQGLLVRNMLTGVPLGE